ncbi:hypothetical protein [Mycolicibacter icosiumassiliensis]|uniref:hypothetical protein n=1 Tax=Mycolicibacter icosiumassiliensis TaxID=1792835 RepID=UPI0012B6805A|nr:hypothetical protein [Mycolicibacter icosiumassiliensis]
MTDSPTAITRRIFIGTCSYVTAMTLAENGMIVGGVGSVSFSPPRLTSCAG